MVYKGFLKKNKKNNRNIALLGNLKPININTALTDLLAILLYESTEILAQPL